MNIMPRRVYGAGFLLVGLTSVMPPFLALAAEQPSATSYASGKNAGVQSGALAVGAFGNKDASKNNITMPMTGGSTMMRTVDGTSSFSASASAPSSGQFLELLIQPGTHGDLTMVTVGQDTDADGTLDHSFILNVPVSGVCANGFISCSPGTWNSCRPYGWIPASGGKVTFGEVPLTTLGGCYCINSSCGSHLVWDNAAVVLKDLGGGIITAIQSGGDASAMVSDVQSDMVSIRYYGRIVSKTTTATTTAIAEIPTAPQTLQSYYTSPSVLAGAGTDMALTQGSNQDGMYYKMVNSAAFAGASQTKRCIIRREGSISTTTDASFSDSGTGSICTDHLVYMKIVKNDNNYSLKLVDTGPGGLGSMHHNCNDDPGGDHWHNFKDFALPPETANYQSGLTKAIFSITNINGPGCNPDGQMSMDGVINGFNNPVVGSAPCPASGAQYPTFNWSYLFEYKTDTYHETVSDTCAALDADPNCRPRNEILDGFTTTMRNFNSTGLTPVPSRRVFTGALGNIEKYHDWWVKEREYVCDAGSSYDLSNVSHRFTSVTSSTTESANIINYTDETKGPSGWSTTPRTITLPAADTFSECEKSCKIKRPRLDTQVGVTGIPATFRDDQNTFDYYYFPCIDEVTCPAEPGDTIVTACSCLNDFGQAASVMQLMRMSGGDNICSSGVAKQP